MTTQIGTAPEVPTLTKGRTARTIALRPQIQGVWWKMDEGSGTTITDELNGQILTVAGATTNLWDNANAATLNADTAFVGTNNSFLDNLLRLSTLDGTLLVGLSVKGGTPSATGVAWGVGDNSDTVGGGFAGLILNPAGAPHTLSYTRVGGPNNQTWPANLSASIKDIKQHFYHWAIHRIGGMVYADGYVDGFHSRSCRCRAIEGLEPPLSTTNRGIRIGARPNGGSGGSAGYLGAQITLPQVANFHALRIKGDQRHLIPGWVHDIARSMPYGRIPEVLSNG